MRRAAIALLASAIGAAALIGCGGEKVVETPKTLKALVQELQGDPVAELPVFSDEECTKQAFVLATTELVEPLEVKAVIDPDTEARFSAYRIKHNDREGWIPAEYLKR